MPAVLLTSAGGQGKTYAAIQHIKRKLSQNPFSSVWVLLPGELQIQAFRARLLAELDEAVYFGIRLFDFYALYDELLRLSSDDALRPVREVAQQRILRHL